MMQQLKLLKRPSVEYLFPNLNKVFIKSLREKKNFTLPAGTTVSLWKEVIQKKFKTLKFFVVTRRVKSFENAYGIHLYP